MINSYERHLAMTKSNIAYCEPYEKQCVVCGKPHIGERNACENCVSRVVSDSMLSEIDILQDIILAENNMSLIPDNIPILAS